MCSRKCPPFQWTDLSRIQAWQVREEKNPAPSCLFGWETLSRAQSEQLYVMAPDTQTAENHSVVNTKQRAQLGRWRAWRGLMAEVTHELRHKGACQLKGDESEGQREDIQRCKTVWCFTWFIMGSLSHWQGPESHEQSGRMEVGETWEELKLGGSIAMIKNPDCRLLLSQVWSSICSLFLPRKFLELQNSELTQDFLSYPMHFQILSSSLD